MKVVFAGTPDFAATALAAIIQSEHEVIAVYTQPDRPAGRGRKLHMSPVKTLALTHQIPVHQPVSLKDLTAQAELAALDADVMVVAAYGLLLPEAVLTIPRYGCLNIHASLLPRWRGAAPIQHAILAGDNETGITIMQMDKGLDTGDMLLKKSIAISATTTGGALHDALATLGAQCILQTLQAIQQQQLQPIKQNDDESCYAHKIDKSQAKINWQQPTAVIDRLIRAFNPWPVAHTDYNNSVIRIWQATPVEHDAAATAGTILDVSKRGVVVKTEDQALCLTELQLAGTRRMHIRDILNGHPDLFSVGCTFS